MTENKAESDYIDRIRIEARIEALRTERDFFRSIDMDAAADHCEQAAIGWEGSLLDLDRVDAAADVIRKHRMRPYSDGEGGFLFRESTPGELAAALTDAGLLASPTEVALGDTATDSGLEQRYHVQKISDPTGKHVECRYFVLDPEHDPIARTALRAYRDSVWKQHGHDALVADLDAWLGQLDACDRGPCWRGRGHKGPCEPGGLNDPRRHGSDE